MQYKQILWFAKKHYVEVIPEIDAPGHGHAAIRSMEARFVRDGDSEYRLKDPQDRTPYLTSRNWFESAMNPCLDSTYNFIEHVLTHIQRLHNRIQPLKTFSVRGDGVPDGAWENSPQCHRLLRRLPRYNKAKGGNSCFAFVQLLRLCLVVVGGVCLFCFDWLGVSCSVTFEPRHLISNNVAV